MLERFTDRSRRVMDLAQEHASTLNHDYIGTEHLLLGLIGERRGVAARALASLGITIQAARQQVEAIIGQGQQAPAGPFTFTPQASQVLKLSSRQARELGHNYVGTEHILLGLIREGGGVALQVLNDLGVDPETVRQGRGVFRSGSPVAGDDSGSDRGVISRWGRWWTPRLRDAAGSRNQPRSRSAG
jgi:ATP-dependent Clp protease ATP-binding subunit ClpC